MALLVFCVFTRIVNVKSRQLDCLKENLLNNYKIETHNTKERQRQ